MCLDLVLERLQSFFFLFLFFFLLFLLLLLPPVTVFERKPNTDDIERGCLRGIYDVMCNPRSWRFDHYDKNLAACLCPPTTNRLCHKRTELKRCQERLDFKLHPWRSQAVFALMRPVKWALRFFSAMVVIEGSLKCRPPFFWAVLFVGCWLTAIINADSGTLNCILFSRVCARSPQLFLATSLFLESIPNTVWLCRHFFFFFFFFFPWMTTIMLMIKNFNF